MIMKFKSNLLYSWSESYFIIVLRPQVNIEGLFLKFPKLTEFENQTFTTQKE